MAAFLSEVYIKFYFAFPLVANFSIRLDRFISATPNNYV